jgi:hypothetical protein
MNECELKRAYTDAEIAKKHNISIGHAKRLITIGTGIEMEHTDSNETAGVIASHHIYEFINYYSKKNGLQKMEADFAKCR